MRYRIREIRQRRHMTQENLAKLSGISRTTIVKLESGEDCETKVETLAALAKALDVPIARVFCH